MKAFSDWNNIQVELIRLRKKISTLKPLENVKFDNNL